MHQVEPQGREAGEDAHGAILSSTGEKLVKHGGDCFLGMETRFADPESQFVA